MKLPSAAHAMSLACTVVALGCGPGLEPYKPTAGTGGAAAGTGGTAGSGSGSGGAAPAGSGGVTAPGTGGANNTGTGGASSGTGGRAPGTGGTPGSGGATGTGGPGAPLLPLPWSDNFESNAVNGGAAGWIKDPADATAKWAVVMDGPSKVLQEQATVSSTSLIVGGDIAWADQKVEARVKFTTVSSSSLALVAARFVDFDNYYFLHLKGDGSIKVRKRIVVSGSTSTIDVLSYKSGTPLVAATWYTVAVEIKGNVVTAYLNGTAVGTMMETAVSLARGGIALGFQDAAGSFDDVKVTQP